MKDRLVVQKLALELPGFSLGPLSFVVEPRAPIAVLGRAGSGKSLLLYALAGLSPEVRGGVHLGELHLDTRRPQDWQRRVGLVFQCDALLDEETTLENVALAARGRGVPEPEARAREALEAVGLKDACDMLPAELSGGMRRRAGLARALVGEPKLLLADDVTAGLDPSTAAEVMDRLLALAEERGTLLVLATQDVDTVLPRVPRALVLEGGRAIFSGMVEGLAADERARSFAPLPVVNARLVSSPKSRA